MAELTVNKVGLNGTSVSFTAADSNGDYFDNDGRSIFIVKNENTSNDCNVTIHAQKKCNQGHLHDITATVPVGETYYFEDLEEARFNDENGDIQVDYDMTTDVKVTVLKY